MSPTPKAITEELARSKGFFHRHDVLRSMVSLAQAVKALHNTPVFGHDRTHITGLITEMIQHLSRTEEVRRFMPEGLSYEKGQEKRLMANLVALLKKISQDQATESLEDIRARKLRLDRAIIRGQKLLDVGKAKDAMSMFHEALKNYVDEHMVFFHIGNKLAQAGQHQAALTFLLKGTEAAPREALMFRAAAQSLLELGKMEQAAKYMNRVLALGQKSPENYALFARILEVQGKYREASQLVKKALDINPTHRETLKIRKRLAKALSTA